MKKTLKDEKCSLDHIVAKIVSHKLNGHMLMEMAALKDLQMVKIEVMENSKKEKLNCDLNVYL